MAAIPERRKKDVNWRIDADSVTGNVSHADAELAVFMDLRDELKEANRINRELLEVQRNILGIFKYGNFPDVPRKLERIARNAAKIKSNTEPGK